MTRYRGPAGTVDAVLFVSRDDMDVLCIRTPGAEDGSPLPAWVVEALNDKHLELGAVGRVLIVNHRGGSYGLAPGDWIIKDAAGDIRTRTKAQFEAEYERVDG